MKSLVLLGGLMGFVIGAGLGLVHEKSLPSALIHACVGLYMAGMLMRWWGKVWMNALKESRQERRRG